MEKSVYLAVRTLFCSKKINRSTIGIITIRVIERFNCEKILSYGNKFTA